MGQNVHRKKESKVTEGQDSQIEPALHKFSYAIRYDT